MRRFMSISVSILTILTVSFGLASAEPAGRSASSEGTGKVPGGPVFFLHPDEFETFQPVELPEFSLEQAPNAWDVADVPFEELIISKDLMVPQAIEADPSWVEVEQAGASTLDLDQITDTRQFPFRTVVKLFIEYPNGQGGVCSGSLILGERTVLTAGHCIYNAESGGWASRVTVVPAMNGRSQPYGQFAATRIATLSPWINGESEDHDIALLELDRPTGTGHMGLAWYDNFNDLRNSTMNSAGYPSRTYSGYEMYFQSDAMDFTRGFQAIYTGCAEGGMSGGPTWLFFQDGSRSIVGPITQAQVNRDGSPACPGANLSVLIDKERYRWASCAALSAGERIPLGLDVSGAKLRNGDMLTVRATHPNIINSCVDLYAAVEFAGQFYFLPNLTPWTEPVSTDDLGSDVTLLDFQVSGVGAPIDLTFHAAMLHSDDGYVASEPGVRSVNLTLEP